MAYIKDLLEHLVRPGVSELALATARNPCVKMNGTYEIVDRTVLSTDEILMMLMVAGGARHVDNLGTKPTSWGVRVDGVGPIAVVAVLNKGSAQARFTLMNRETAQREGLASIPPNEDTGSSGTRSPSVPPAAPVPKIEVASPKKSVAIMAAPEGNLDVELDDSRAPASASPTSSIPATTKAGPSTAPAALSPGPLELGGQTFELDVDSHAVPKRVASPAASEHASVPVAAAAAPLLIGLSTDSPAPPSATPAPAPPRASVRVDFKVEASIDDVLLAARSEGASDLHLVAGRPALFRLAGRLLPRGEPIDPDLLVKLLMPRIPPRLHAQLEKEGSCDFALSGEGIGRARVNVTRQRTGLKGSFRLIANEIPTLATLGLPEAIGNATHHHQGLIVITGPTGHGKTTTMAAVVDLINSNTTHHVITVEDPIEYVHPRKKAMLSQREVGTSTKTFAAALKGSLREDPDVIVVGELRDTETVRMALSASETGHLVVGTMNTPSAAKTIDRLIDLFPPGDQAQVRITLAGGLRLIVSQRLLPRKDGPGMVAAAEILPGSVPLWNLIRDNKTYQIPSLQQRGKGFGIIRLDDSLAELVNTFKVSAEDAIAVADSPEELESTLSGKRLQATPPIVSEGIKPPAATNAPPPPDSAANASGEKPKGLFERAGAFFGKKG
jgi:twitching motility protein PilT